MYYWKKLTPKQQDERISQALQTNINYSHATSLGVPASYLDEKVFYDQAAFLKDAPLLRTYVHNPNHIGCHTLGESEPFFKGTQDIEREVIAILSVDILAAQINACDGYIAAGGTEANLQAVWIYRNYFMQVKNAVCAQIVLLASADTHYSIAKAANVFGIDLLTVPVDDETRMIDQLALNQLVLAAKERGQIYFIIIANMATTMFGSVDDPAPYVEVMQKNELAFKLHVDGAFGGFIYPLSHPNHPLNFANEHISSITLDAHKMLQAPYGTGVFLVRKGLMEFVYTKQAKYVNGMDITLSGSRSGANAIAVWMILQSYGYYGWMEKINLLLTRTNWCCGQLDKMGVRYFRNPDMNIITIRASEISTELAHKYYLVPDVHIGAPNWFKIVVMDHVDRESLELFVQDLQQFRQASAK